MRGILCLVAVSILACAPSRGTGDSGPSTGGNSDGGPDKDGGASCGSTTADPNNCGACGMVCPKSLTGIALCANSECSLQCNADPSGTNCAAPSACSNGHCCAAGTSYCDSACVDTDSDVNNCGSCGHVCQAQTGTQAQCSSGMCNSNCTGGQTLCGAACTNTDVDNSNCGGCGHVCGGGTSCVSSSCECGSSLSMCNSQCVDTTSDVNDCGSCGRQCQSGQRCVNSGCVATSSCTIDANLPWQQCDGFTVTAGQQLTMTASGTFTSAGLCGDFSNGPSGNTPTCPWCVVQLPDTGAPCGALLWGIQASAGAGVTPSGDFNSGGNVSTTAPSSGFVAFQVNDDWYTADTGTMLVQVTAR